jgi:putative glutamine amidotransferase
LARRYDGRNADLKPELNRHMSSDATNPLIGLSPRILRDVPRELGFRGKTLQYLEQSMAHWAMRLGAIVVMVPTIESAGSLKTWDIETGDYVAALDGLILQGGADIDPTVYGEMGSDHVGPTDVVRDRFELEMLRAFAAADKPVLGVCRGMQLINVACGGSLHHDLPTAGINAQMHRVTDLYDEHTHKLNLVPGSWLRTIYNDTASGCVNSIHHQAVKRLGENLLVEATAPDGVVECIRHRDLSFMVGVQWHPEFHDERFPSLLPMEPLLQAFLNAAAARHKKGG